MKEPDQTPTLAERLRLNCERYLPPQYRADLREAADALDRLTAALSLAERERDVANGMVDRLALIAQESRRERDSLREQLAQAGDAIKGVLGLFTLLYARDDVSQELCDVIEQSHRVITARELVERMPAPNPPTIMVALEESVKLQSHYAALLNDYDGGKRMIFTDAKAWTDRLAALERDAARKRTEEVTEE